MNKVLIVDDDVAVTNYFMVFLMQTGTFEPEVVNDSRKVPGLLGEREYDAILLDMDMPTVSGMDILKLVRERGIDTPVIVLTGVSDVELAVRAMKLGAFDYLTKPVDDEKLLEVLNNSLEHRQLYDTIEELPSELSRQDLAHESVFEEFPTNDPSMIRMLHQAEKIAGSELSVFIWGERGVGKEDLARAIHRSSPRSNAAFITADPASQNPDRFAALLFGEARAWGGKKEESPGFLEEAAGGTLFLDEVDSLTLPLQVRLRRVIQTCEYYRERSARIRQTNVRFITASTLDLTQEKYRDRFSRDLLYHLMVNSIRIPPLRERPDDIPLLAEHFLRKEREKTGKDVKGFSEEFMELLKGYGFPDNVQELKTIVAGSVVNEETDTITVDSLSSYIRARMQPESAVSAEHYTPRTMDEIQHEHARKTLAICDGDVEKAAQILQITPEEVRRMVPADEAEPG
ncbi:response regulator [Candidatus Fermentibacteria bacterium]|nr:response regulator [Candidatus Fermentibacteria bacterium]